MVYLAAVIDWYRCYVLAWELSISLAADCWVAALERAMVPQRPEIFHTDQGCNSPARSSRPRCWRPRCG